MGVDSWVLGPWEVSLFTSLIFFFHKVDTSKECTLSYDPIGKKVNTHNLDYAQSKLSSYNTTSNDTPPPQVPAPPRAWALTGRKSHLLGTTPSKDHLLPPQLQS